MSQRRSRARGIYCLEGDWWPNPKHHTSVRPILELLAQPGLTKVPFVYHDVATRPEFEHYVRRWLQRRFDDYPVLYLALHGSAGCISFGQGRGNNNEIGLEELGDLLEGACRGRVLYFGTCETLDVHGQTLNRLLRVTGAAGVVGYRHEVDWMVSAAFEVLLLSSIQDCSMTKSGLRRLERILRREAPGMAKNLALRVHVHP